MDALTELRNARSFQEGYAAYIAKIACQAPARFGVYSGTWVEGWEAALFDNADFSKVQAAAMSGHYSV